MRAQPAIVAVLAAGFVLAFVGAGRAAGAAEKPKTPAVADIIAAAKPAEWRELDPANTLYLDLPGGRVILELAPAFAPLHVANIRTLVRGGYFDGLAVIRLQDNFVAQIGDPDDRRLPAGAQEKLPPEYTVPLDVATPFNAIPDRDGYAPSVGFSLSMPAARDVAGKEQWLPHCYGAVGVARSNEPTSGNGSSFYVVIGQAPRQLDRNLAVVGRVWSGIELLSSLRRGPGAMGFYEAPGDRTLVSRVRLAADVPAGERTRLQVLRSDSPSFATLLEARRNRQDDFYRRPAGFLEVCNVAVPVRPAP